MKKNLQEERKKKKETMNDESTNEVDEKHTAISLRNISEENQNGLKNDKNDEKKKDNDEKKNWMKKTMMKNDENHGKKIQMKLSIWIKSESPAKDKKNRKIASKLR